MSRLWSVAIALVHAASHTPHAHADPLLTLTLKQDPDLPFLGWGVHQDVLVEVDAAISNVPAGFSFGAVAFDVTYSAQPAGLGSSGLFITHPQTSDYSWNPNLSTWVNDSPPRRSHVVFSTNGDQGTSNVDLQGVVVTIDNSFGADFSGQSGGDPGDPRPNLLQSTETVPGFSTPYMLGSFPLQWDGKYPIPIFGGSEIDGGIYTVSVTNVQLALLDDSTLQYTPAILQSDTPADFVVHSAILTAPEPATASTLLLGALLLNKKRRR